MSECVNVCGAGEITCGVIRVPNEASLYDFVP